MQNWLDALGMPITLDSPFMRNLYDRVDQVCDKLYSQVQRHLIKRVLKELDGKLKLYGDATFRWRSFYDVHLPKRSRKG